MALADFFLVVPKRSPSESGSPSDSSEKLVATVVDLAAADDPCSDDNVLYVVTYAQKMSNQRQKKCLTAKSIERNLLQRRKCARDLQVFPFEGHDNYRPIDGLEESWP